MNIYVGNLPYNVRDQQLGDLFGQYGDVTSAKVIIDRESNRSKGFGFVEMADGNAGQEAISALDGQDFEGRPLKVNEARPRPDRGGPR